MTSQDKIEFLRRYKAINKRIDQEHKEILKWHCMATKVTPAYSDMPKGGEASDKIQTAVEEIAKIEDQINADKGELIKLEAAAMLKGIILQRNNWKSTFLILVVPPNGKPYEMTIGKNINNMEDVLESQKAIFEYYEKVIIATNRKNNGYIKNSHVKGKKIFGTCYFIGNSRNDDFRSLSEKEIHNLLTESLIM